MRNPTKEELKLVVAAENVDDPRTFRLFDNIEHMKKSIREICGCNMSAAQRKKTGKQARSMGLPVEVASKSTCYAVARGIIENMRVQIVQLDELNSGEIKLLHFLVVFHKLSPVKDLLIHQIHKNGEYYNMGSGACGWFANAAIAWNKRMDEGVTFSPGEYVKFGPEDPDDFRLYGITFAGNQLPVDQVSPVLSAKFSGGLIDTYTIDEVNKLMNTVKTVKVRKRKGFVKLAASA